MTIRTVCGAALLAGSLALGGCATTSGNGTPSITDVQNAAVAACGFLPTAATVAGIISAAAGGTGSMIIQTATQVAGAICQAVTTKQAAKGAAPPMVNGVVIRGKFVR